ncbi:MAG: DUF418 domain-containing protein [Pirellula sp.]
MADQSPPVSSDSNATGPVNPAGGSERWTSIDVVRGVAVLGILPMNILSIGLPGAARLKPTIAGGFEGTDRLLWWLGYLLFDEKMIALFSMLFGAGLVLQADRALQSGRSAAGLFYRRVFFLLLIGLVHAYFVWDGDILVTYALCGMLLYPARRLPPRWLIGLGIAMLLVAVLGSVLIAFFFSEARSAAEHVLQQGLRGVPSTDADRIAVKVWAEIRTSFYPTSDELFASLEQARNEGYLDHVRRKAPEALAVQTELFLTAFLWLVGGRMLIGMALMKLDILTGKQSPRFYWCMAGIGYGIGLPSVALCGNYLIASQFDPVAIFGGGLLWNSFAGVLVALGHIGLVIAILKAGWMPNLTAHLAAVGRMALTNYLMQSLLCTTLFCGWGFGFIGQLDRTQLDAVVLSIWSLQLAISPLWLQRFRFGPAEWLWRCLTYGKWQSLRS